MATERTKNLYEILIRLGPDGFQGAHVKDLERITEDGEVLAERESEARPVTLAEVGDLLGKQAAKLIEAADSARAEAGDATSKIAAAEAGRQQAEEALAAAVSTLRQALAMIAP